MQWILRSLTARSFEGKWSPKIRLPYDDPEDLEDDIPLVFHKPSWQLRASLASVLITPVLYQLYLIMVTIRYILFLQTFSSPPRPACPVVDLSWTGVFPCELGWRGSALAVFILSAVLITCYSLITACLVRWNPRKQWNIQYCTTSEKPTQFQVRVQSTNRPPTLSLYILLLIFRLLLQSGDVEANPGPTLSSTLTIDDLSSVYGKLIPATKNWFNLGLTLGVSYDTLNNIGDKHRDDQTCLREILAARLKTGPLTYSEICQSLRAPIVERNEVAEAIEEACTVDDTSPGPSKRQILSTTTPGPTSEDDERYDNQLCIEDLQEVYSLLIKAAKDWFDMGLALGIRVDILKGIKYNENSDKAHLREMLTHWLRYLPSCTWSDICKCLRSDTVQQDILADIIKEKYKVDNILSGPSKRQKLSTMNPGPTSEDDERYDNQLFIEDLQEVFSLLIKAARNWFNIGLALGIKVAILEGIESNEDSDKARLREVLTHWLQSSPSRTWSDICKCLRSNIVQQDNIADAIELKYKGFKQHFEEAMKDGFVTLKTVNVILMGPAGSGKTSVKDLVLNNEVKEKQNSTGPLDRTIQVRSVASHHFMCKGKEWNEMTTQDLKSLLSRAISQYSLKGVDKKSSTSAAENIHDHSKAAVKGVNKKSSTSAAENIHDHSQAAVKAVVDDLEEISSIAVSTSVRHKSGKELFGTMTIRVTDSGGQPQFHDIAPLFTRGTSAGVYVMKLTDKFNDYPSDECYIGGQQVGTPSLSHLSHKETILSLIQSLISVNTHEKKPRCIFVGTFKDAFKNDPPSVLSATLEKKNEELSALIPERFRLYSDTQMTQQILALNAISRDEDTQTIAHAIRNAVEESPFFEDEVPLRWFALELSLQEFCTKVGRHILTKSECISVAKELQSDTDDIESALEYFDKICIIHYYPQKLPGVVFVDPQVPLEIINDLVRYAMSLRGGGECTLATATLMDPKWKLFRDGGILTLDMLESEDFKKHFLVGIFVPKDMIELMKELLVITPLTNPLLGESANTSQFFMPTLLKSIPRAELKNCCINEPWVDPLLVRFTNGCIRAGVFCCLVVFLMERRGWERYSKLGEKVPQARNCIKLKYRKNHCFVTLVDSNTHIEVYVKARKIICENLCPKIKEDILEGIRASQEGLHYSIDAPEICCFCPCKYGAIKCHHAEIDVDCYTGNCSEKPDEYDGKLENTHLIWFGRFQDGDTTREIVKESKPSTIIGAKRDKKNESGGLTLGSILTIDDLRSVNNKLIKAAGKWKALGIALGLDHSTLNDIEDDYHKNKDCLCEMLAARLNKTDPLITYSDICQSLREPIVRQDAIAKAIEEEFTDDDTLPGPSKTQKLSPGPTMQ
ncbi:uncharacterized protein LOC135347306 isoform X3 [Halichondria panicea]|uniref:uncharacterized protein LOC135347306 isoform X3 n=1 Tax=Halichondria panicea TaxID=6063 RepID=UPI00312B9E19